MFHNPVNGCCWRQWDDSIFAEGPVGQCCAGGDSLKHLKSNCLHVILKSKVDLMHPSTQAHLSQLQGDYMMMEVLPLLSLCLIISAQGQSSLFLSWRSSGLHWWQMLRGCHQPFWVVCLCRSGKAQRAKLLLLHGDPTTEPAGHSGQPGWEGYSDLYHTPQASSRCLCALAFPAGFSQLCVCLCLLWFNLWLKVYCLQFSGRETSSPVSCW